jgi:hypothetical protein
LFEAQTEIDLVSQRLDPCKSSARRNQRDIRLSYLDNDFATFFRCVDDRVKNYSQVRPISVLSRYHLIGNVIEHRGRSFDEKASASQPEVLAAFGRR